jgi:hypothetical protein
MLLYSGLDTLSVRVLTSSSPSDYLISQYPTWRLLKKEYRQSLDPSPVYIDLPVLGLFELKVVASRPYEFVFSHPDICEIRIWNPEKWGAAQRTLTGEFFVTFRSVYLLTHTIQEVQDLIEQLVRAFSCAASSTWVKISRVDLCCDLVHPALVLSDLDSFRSESRKRDLVFSTPSQDNKGVDTSSLPTSPFEYQRNVYSRSRGIQTSYFGRMSACVYARIYDKTEQIKAHHNESLLSSWHNSGYTSGSVQRVEFSLNGDFLTGVEFPGRSPVHLVDFLQVLPSIWSYLTSSWLYTVDDFLSWSLVQSALSSVPSEPVSRVTVRQSNSLRQPLLDQAIGCLKSFGLSVSRTMEDVPSLIFYALEALQVRCYTDKFFQQLIDKSVRKGILFSEFNYDDISSQAYQAVEYPSRFMEVLPNLVFCPSST